MNNKLLVIAKFPYLDLEYEIFVPINKKVGTIKNLIIDTAYELSGGVLKKDNLSMYESETGRVFDNNIYVKNSDIKNGTKLLFF